MNEQAFALMPFPAANLPAVTITGRISFQRNLLSLHYALAGNIQDVLLSPVSRNPSRTNELWKSTCFEFFLAIKDQPGYWEFNMSPSGDWNAYRMDTYRRIGFREETGISQLPFECKEETGKFLLNASVDLTPIIRPVEELQMGITAVIQTKAGNETYWALAHPASQPDFHVRESFILWLVAQTRPVEQFALDG